MKFLYILILALFSELGFGQQTLYDTLRNDNIDSTIMLLKGVDKRFESLVDISVGRAPITDLLRTVAKTSGVNLTVKGDQGINVTCNFTRTSVADLLLFVCREYNMQIAATGNIVTIYPRVPSRPKPREIYVTSDSTSGFISFDLKNDNLLSVTKKMCALSGVNIVIPASLHQMQISGYVTQMPLADALTTLCSINGLVAHKTGDKVWAIMQSSSDNNQSEMSLTTFRPQIQFTDNELSIDSTGMIRAHISRGEISDIISDVCRRQGRNYFFVTPVSQAVSVFVNGVSFETLLNVIFTGSPYSYYKQDGIYFFGASAASGGKDINNVEVIALKHRSVNKVIDIIPSTLQKGVSVVQFSDQNSLVVSGQSSDVSRIRSFIDSIDTSVPLIAIDIIIVDSKKSNAMEAGLDIGFGNEPVKSSGRLSPGIDVTLGASTVNRLIESFNGFGSINIGKVSPNFYMSLKLLEENGTIELRSTPKLSTLNGHEASLKSGETKYYKEVINNIIGSQNPIQSESYTWKSVEANLAIKITPYVSQNNHITMEIEIEQNEFTPREEKNAPPGSVTRSFKSKIKVENEDMVLLGGIERNSHEKSAVGLPFISRIPVLKWIFGQTTDNKVVHKLNVFIKPTVMM